MSNDFEILPIRSASYYSTVISGNGRGLCFFDVSFFPKSLGPK